MKIQLSMLRYRLSLLRDHGNGKLPLLRALYIFVWAWMPALIAFGVRLAVPNSESQWPSDFFLFALWISALATLWWCKGLFCLGKRFVAERRVPMAILTFGFAVLGFWFVAVKVLAFTVVMTFDYYQTLSDKAACIDGQVRFPKPASIVIASDGRRLLLSGALGRGTAVAFEHVLIQHPSIKLVELNSSGGYVVEASAMRRLLEENGVNTLVVGLCASACTDVFLGGHKRYIGTTANFGFHQSGDCARERDDLTWGAREYENAKLYRKKLIQRTFALKALGTSYFSLWQPSPEDVKDSGFATDWWPPR